MLWRRASQLAPVVIVQLLAVAAVCCAAAPYPTTRALLRAASRSRTAAWARRSFRPPSRPALAPSPAAKTGLFLRTATMTAAASTSSTAEGQQQKKNPFNFSWQQTMIRIKDPKVSLPFYEDVLGFRRLHEYHFDSFSLYFLFSPRPSEVASLPSSVGTKESEAYLWTMPGTTIELTWNHGTEKDPSFSYNNGNVEPHRGFGHLAIAANDVYKACEKFEQQGVSFQKKPDEGRMKGLAFLKDPDGYWIEVVSRDPGAFSDDYPYNLAQTMLRVKDPAKSLGFYRDLLGMHLLAVKHFSDFSLYFLTQHAPENAPSDPESEEAHRLLKTLHDPVLELTHNHGTESDPEFKYHNGNTEPRGFGHTGFLVDDLEAACAFLEQQGVAFQKRPSEGSMRGLAFAKDPDDYWVEIVGRGLAI